MNFISSENGQALQLIVMDEVRPVKGGGLFLPDFISRVMDRYRFLSTSNQTDPTQPFKFQTGVVELDGEAIPITSLEIYNDGIIVNSRNTEDADKIMDEFFEWALAEFHLREPTTEIPRTYQSRVVVAFDRSLNTFLNHFVAIKDVLTKAFDADGVDLNVVRLTIGPHPPGTLPYKSTWAIEARTIGPFVPNRYFSAAPLSTPAHLEMLAELEATAAR